MKEDYTLQYRSDSECFLVVAFLLPYFIPVRNLLEAKSGKVDDSGKQYQEIIIICRIAASFYLLHWNVISSNKYSVALLLPSVYNATASMIFSRYLIAFNMHEATAITNKRFLK